MKKYPVYNINAEKIKEVELNPKIFEVPVKEAVVHQVAVAQMANARKNIAHTKTRGEVRGGGVKPWRQKGTGRARHGSNRSPIWVGGGITFGPTKEKNFVKKVNKKMRRKAIFMCLTDKINNNLLILLDKLDLENGKTKDIIKVIQNLKELLKLEPIKKKENKKTPETQKIQKKQDANKKFDIKKHKLSLLVVLPKSDKKIFRAGRNLEGVKVITADSLNVIDMLQYKKIIMAEAGLKVIQKTYLKND